MHLSPESNFPQEIVLLWLRRDLRLTDNTALLAAIESGLPVLPLFIFDVNILTKLEDRDDPRVQFIHQHISLIHHQLSKLGSTILVLLGDPLKVFQQVIKKYKVRKVFANHDYEPYAINRDAHVEQMLTENEVEFLTTKDQVIFEKTEILKISGMPFRVYTPYMKKWKEQVSTIDLKIKPMQLSGANFLKIIPFTVPTLQDLGFKPSSIEVPPAFLDNSLILNYSKTRDFPAIRGTSRIGAHLRFGTISIREIVKRALATSEIFLNELIWREFYMMILYNFPHVEKKAFKPAFDNIIWINDEANFHKWCKGKTGYPLVDAGMRELNATGFMHNRVRMVVASFLTKHLLIDWRWGEAYFARKLLDYELASNNGGWQWAAGTGTDAQPYFRIFNPMTQMEKFDKSLQYVKKWVPEVGTNIYPAPVVEHKLARARAIQAYERAVK